MWDMKKPRDLREDRGVDATAGNTRPSHRLPLQGAGVPEPANDSMGAPAHPAFALVGKVPEGTTAAVSVADTATGVDFG